MMRGVLGNPHLGPVARSLSRPSFARTSHPTGFPAGPASRRRAPPSSLISICAEGARDTWSANNVGSIDDPRLRFWDLWFGVLFWFGTLWGSWSRSTQRVRALCVRLRGSLSSGPSKLGADPAARGSRDGTNRPPRSTRCPEWLSVSGPSGTLSGEWVFQVFSHLAQLNTQYIAVVQKRETSILISR